MSLQLDHRQIADEMEIFMVDDQIGAGLPIWLPNGMALREALESWIKKIEKKAGYHRVASPHIAKSDLYEMSGHLKKFKNDMFPPMSWPDDQSQFYLRPMNCPHHHKIFASSLRSYRHLPLRIAEYGQVYRYENSGSLRGLSRVRGLCQNDAHIYVDPEGASMEIEAVLDLHERCYRDLGLKEYRYRLSKHDPKRSSDFDGPRERWIECEALLRQSLEKKGLPYFEAEGEAAFYGPKIDVQMKMLSGQEESIASVQLDFMSAERFDLSFVQRDGRKKRPWIIHRAPLGSHERFIAMLLESYQGQLPGWLAPIQLSIIPLSAEAKEFAQGLKAKSDFQDVRIEVDQNEGSLSKRIRFAHRLRPFCILILGDKELKCGRAHLQFRRQQVEIGIHDLSLEIRKRIADPAAEEGATSSSC